MVAARLDEGAGGVLQFEGDNLGGGFASMVRARRSAGGGAGSPTSSPAANGVEEFGAREPEAVPALHDDAEKQTGDVGDVRGLNAVALEASARVKGEQGRCRRCLADDIDGLRAAVSRRCRA